MSSFGDAALDLLPHQLFHLRLVSRAAARSRHERAHAHIHAQSALHHFEHRARDGALLREGGFESAPVARDLHFDGGEQVVAFVIAAADGDQHFHARLQLDLRIGRQHAVHLAADIDKGAVRGNGDDGSFHRFAPRMVRLFELRKDIAKGGVEVITEFVVGRPKKYN